MEIRNKLGLDGIEVRYEKERISKQKARRLYDEHVLETFEVGTYAGLQASTSGSLRTYMTLPDRRAR